MKCWGAINHVTKETSKINVKIGQPNFLGRVNFLETMDEIECEKSSFSHQVMLQSRKTSLDFVDDQSFACEWSIFSLRTCTRISWVRSTTLICICSSLILCLVLAACSSYANSASAFWRRSWKKEIEDYTSSGLKLDWFWLFRHVFEFWHFGRQSGGAKSQELIKLSFLTFCFDSRHNVAP